MNRKLDGDPLFRIVPDNHLGNDCQYTYADTICMETYTILSEFWLFSTSDERDEVRFAQHFHLTYASVKVCPSQ